MYYTNNYHNFILDNNVTTKSIPIHILNEIEIILSIKISSYDPNNEHAYINLIKTINSIKSKIPNDHILYHNNLDNKIHEIQEYLNYCYPITQHQIDKIINMQIYNQDMYIDLLVQINNLQARIPNSDYQNHKQLNNKQNELLSKLDVM